MKIAIFWDVAPHGPLDIERHFREAYCLHNQGQYLPDYMMKNPRRKAYSKRMRII
jgi:hypothetical protein